MATQTIKAVGKKISLTHKQRLAIMDQVDAMGLCASVTQGWTGSVYITIHSADSLRSIARGIATEVAKIRLSNHEVGFHDDNTHECVGTKSECLAYLKEVLAEIAAEAPEWLSEKNA